MLVDCSVYGLTSTWYDVIVRLDILTFALKASTRIYTNGSENRFINFNTADKPFEAWFSADNLINSSWSDIARYPILHSCDLCCLIVLLGS